MSDGLMRRTDELEVSGKREIRRSSTERYRRIVHRERSSVVKAEMGSARDYKEERDSKSMHCQSRLQVINVLVTGTVWQGERTAHPTQKKNMIKANSRRVSQCTPKVPL